MKADAIESPIVPTTAFPAIFASIIKRDGAREAFDATRIERAILAAGRATREFSENEARLLSRRVLAIAAATTEMEPTVEGIQDVVEEVLIASPYRRAARAYIIYREQHRILREIQLAGQLALVDSYLDKSDWQVAENANMAFSLQGLNNHISSEVTRKYWLERLYSPEVRTAHESGDFHIHDLNLLASTASAGIWRIFCARASVGPAARSRAVRPSTSAPPLARWRTFSTPCKGKRPGRRRSPAWTRCSRRSSPATGSVTPT